MALFVIVMRLVSVFLLLFLPQLLFAEQPLASVPAAPQIDAKAYLLLDFNSGQFLVDHDSSEHVEPASLTKLMTAYITFAALKKRTITLDQQVRVSKRAWHTGGSRMFIEPRMPVTVDQLIHGMIVQSGNDACVALAETVAGSEEVFAQMMNREAARLGMKDTHFVNATGLPDPQHYSSAHDTALLAAAIVRDFPEYFPLYSIKEFRYNNITQWNRNRLLWRDPTVDGMKTGHTENAGYCLVATARRGGQRLISVVMGTASASARARQSQKLLNYGFQFYDSPRLYEKNQSVATLRVWKGSSNSLKAGFTKDVYLALPKGGLEKLKAHVESLQPLLAPIRAGQKVGVMNLTLDGKPYRKMDVVALEDVPIAGFVGRVWDALRLMVKGLW